MKYHLLVILSLFVLDSKGQDTAKHVSRNSISITGGVNVTYPNSPSMPGGPYGGRPIGSMGAWSSLSYDHLLFHADRVSLGLKLELGLVQYVYRGEFAEEVTYGPPTILQKMNAVTFSPGIFSTITLSKTIGWYNELDLSGESIAYYEYNPNAIGENSWWNVPIQNFTNENAFNLYLSYSTGITINLSKNISMTPLIALPLLNITMLFPQNITASTNTYNTFTDFRTGIMLTYNFNKK